MATARRVILGAAVGLMLAVPVTAHAADTTVSIQNGIYGPPKVTVTQGSSVTWLNNDFAIHDAEATDGTWKTPVLGTGEEATVTFDTAGTYAYGCSLHPRMGGTVTVLPAPPDTSTAPAGTGDSQGGPSVLILVVAGLLGAVVASRRFRTATDTAP